MSSIHETFAVSLNFCIGLGSHCNEQIPLESCMRIYDVTLGEKAAKFGIHVQQTEVLFLSFILRYAVLLLLTTVVSCIMIAPGVQVSFIFFSEIVSPV
jgi:hypothetical protein